MKLKSIHRVERVSWRGRDDLGWVWEWVEDNLGVRAATAVAKMVEKGRVVGLEDLSGRLVRGGKAWGAWMGLLDEMK